MNQHPALVEAMISDRVIELRNVAIGATARIRSEKRGHHVVAAARQGTGWLLVEVGLKLATPRASTGHLVPTGRR